MDKMDRENSCESMQLFAPKTQQFNLIFSGSPAPADLGQGRLDNNPGKSCSGTLLLPPRLQTLLPSPNQLPLNALYRHLSSRSATGVVINGCWTGRLLARAGYVPLLQVMCLWCMCFCAEVFFFLFSHCTPQWSIVWEFIFFFPHDI